MIKMHDWTLLEIRIDWRKDSVTAIFKSAKSQEAELFADGFMDVHIPKLEEWGKSVSVNEVRGPQKVNSEFEKVTIEMQSGDKIEVVARRISLPKRGS